MWDLPSSTVLLSPRVARVGTAPRRVLPGLVISILCPPAPPVQKAPWRLHALESCNVNCCITPSRIKKTSRKPPKLILFTFAWKFPNTLHVHDQVKKHSGSQGENGKKKKMYLATLLSSQILNCTPASYRDGFWRRLESIYADGW